MLLVLLEVCQDRGLGGGLSWFYLEDLVILDVMGDIILPQGRYPERLMLLSSLELCQELGVKKGGY